MFNFWEKKEWRSFYYAQDCVQIPRYGHLKYFHLQKLIFVLLECIKIFSCVLEDSNQYKVQLLASRSLPSTWGDMAQTMQDTWDLVPNHWFGEQCSISPEDIDITMCCCCERLLTNNSSCTEWCLKNGLILNR